MRKPQRYTACGDEVVMADPAGPLVKWEDYKRLDDLCKQLMAQHSDISCENIMLRKAGDELSWAFAFAVSRDDGKESGLIKAWKAAKEGKPSV